MAVMEIKELIKLVTDKFGETPDDDALSIIENISDTFNDISGKVNKDWDKEKARLEQAVIDKDNEWRKKYTERFLSGDNSDDKNIGADNHEDGKPKETEITIDDLFTEAK